MGTILLGNVLNINGIQIEASEDETGYKKISFKDSSDPSGKMKFSGAKVAYSEKTTSGGNLTLDVSNEHHIVHANHSIENVNFTGIAKGTSGLIVIHNTAELSHTVNLATNPDVVMMRTFQLKGTANAYNIIEYTVQDNKIYVQLI